MNYTMIVLDLDGTLTNSKKEMTPRTREALLKAEEKGVKIVLASGRPTYGITALADELDLKTYGGYILAFNGGRITDCKTGKVVYDQPLVPAVVPPLYDMVKAHGFEMLTYQDEKIAATRKANKYVLHEAFINKMPVVEYADFVHEVRYPINKCLVVGDPAPLHQLEQQVVEAFRGQDGCLPLCRFLP
jgi:HAD superfamily hydrolase (TIGR01484 family)